MRLNLTSIIHTPGTQLPFDLSFDFRSLELSGQQPLTEPVRMTGQVRNQAGMLLLEGALSTTLQLHCDRCGRAYEEETHIPLSFPLAEELAGEDEGEFILLEEGELDLEDLAYTSFILGMDTKHLCSENCKGLCSACGADLNEESCRCKAETDPRWQALSQLLDT